MVTHDDGRPAYLYIYCFLIFFDFISYNYSISIFSLKIWIFEFYFWCFSFVTEVCILINLTYIAVALLKYCRQVSNSFYYLELQFYSLLKNIFNYAKIFYLPETLFAVYRIVNDYRYCSIWNLKNNITIE